MDGRTDGFSGGRMDLGDGWICVWIVGFLCRRVDE